MNAPDPRVAEAVRDSVASVLVDHDTTVRYGYDYCYTCGHLDTVGDAGHHQADMLAAAGLLAPPPPRTWQEGDTIPDGVLCVRDAAGEHWLSNDRYGSRGWTHQDDTDDCYGDRSLLRVNGPITEVRLPGAQS